MPGLPFRRYELRTTDVAGARAFYEDVLGAPTLAAGALGVSPLPERARAAGAPAHWLGHIDVAEVEQTVRRLVGMGAEVLGPAQRSDDGVTSQGLRDPLGAVVAVRSRVERPRPPPSLVAWHQLHTTDRARAWSVYGELFGWSERETRALGGEPHLIFAWDKDGPIVGSMADTARSPQTHAHWLFYFGVPELDAALARVRARGGEVILEATLPGGGRLAPCHDPEGAAFGLFSVA